MRKLFIISTTIFWLAVAGFWLADFLRPPAQIVEVVPVVVPSLRDYSLAEVTEHNQEKDCWMAIEGQVYDITSYLPMHPSDPEIVMPWCGKEASQAWQTKTIGRPHSSRAMHLLNRYLIGKLQTSP
jgi:cytochrome b involved in lipid metabolism